MCGVPTFKVRRKWIGTALSVMIFVAKVFFTNS